MSSLRAEDAVPRPSAPTLRRHIPRIAAEWDLDHPRQTWRAVEGTLVFADISGFTALSERLARRGRIGAEELVETLSRIFGAMLDQAAARGGMLLKFGGDALLFLFEGGDHARRAVSAAVEMRTALRAAARIPTSVGRLHLSMSVGIHSDDVLLFLVGAPHRELVVLGAPATITTATEAAAEAGEILVTPATAARLPPDAVHRRADGELLVSWRRPPDPPPGAPAERPVDPDTIRGLFPAALGAVLEPGPPEAEHRVACIAFLRFSGTDALLTEQGPDVVAEALDETLSAMEDAFAEEGVTLLAVDVDKDGGKVFVGSGVPYASEDDEGRILRALRRIADTPLPLPVQSGVNRGHVFAAEVGTIRRAAYSAMGDTTNTAARICAKAPPGSIYAHPSVLEHSRTRFDVEAVGPFTFKGKQHPLMLYELGAQTGRREHDPSAELPLLGRDAELAVVRDAVAGLAAGRGGVLTIVGDAGMGKSRLLREALAGAADRPSIAVTAEAYGANSPYRVFRDPLRRILGVDRGDTPTMADALQRGVAALAPGLLPLVPLLGDAAQVELAPTPAVAAIDPQFRPDRTADTVVALLAAAFPGELVLSAEDVQWADAGSARLLERIADECAHRPWLLVATRRGTPDETTRPAERQVRLGPLPEEIVRALVDVATEAAPLRRHVVDLIVARADGNPLFVQEMARLVGELGTPEAVPDTLHAALAAQVDALAPAARRILRAASVLGVSFRRVVLDEVLRHEQLAGDGFEDLAEVADFVEDDGAGRLRFRTALLRDTTYEVLPYRVRARLHRAAGEAIERLSRDVESDADALALHFWSAGDAERTWRYALVNAERARTAYANVDAAVQYERALDAARRLADVDDAQRAQVWILLGDMRERAGMFEESLEAYRRASRLVGHDPILRAELMLKRARARERAGRFASALAELTRAERLLAAVDSDHAAPMRASLLSFAALVRLGQERFQESLSLAVRAVDAARALAEPAILARALMTLGVADIELHGPGDGRHLREALDLFVELGDLPREAQARGNLGFLAAHAGAWDEAVEWFTTCQRAYERAGDAVGAAIAAGNLGEMLLNQRHFARAEGVLTEAARATRASRFAEGAAWIDLLRARLAVARGRLDDADTALESADAVFAELGQSSSLLEVTAVRAALLIRRGQPELGLEQLARAEQAAGTEAEGMRPLVAEVRASALIALARFDEALAALEPGLATARERGMPYEEALLLASRLEVARRSGAEPDPADAEAVAKIFHSLGIGEPAASRRSD
jgi:class 3 adenylate cyclase/tetratricopeptide (TPR) repeat protein